MRRTCLEEHAIHEHQRGGGARLQAALLRNGEGGHAAADHVLQEARQRALQQEHLQHNQCMVLEFGLLGTVLLHCKITDRTP